MTEIRVAPDSWKYPRQKFRGRNARWYCRTCEAVVDVPDDPSVRCETCRTPRANVRHAAGPAFIEHSIHGSYIRPKYNEGLGEMVKSERHRQQLAAQKGLVPKS